MKLVPNRFMRHSSSWSIGLGRWGGVHVRVHMLFWLFALCTLLLSWSQSSVLAHEGLGWTVAAGIVIWFGSLVAHECGHLLTAVRLGGEGDELVLWPFGGLHPVQPPADPRQELLVHLAGPLVNLGLCAVAGLVVVSHEEGNVSGLLNPLAPQGLLDPAGASPVLVAAKLGCWINNVLWLANLLPAFPFDGGRALRAGILAARPEFTPRRALILVTSLAKVVAFVLASVGFLMWSNKTNPFVPVWFSLVLLALLLYFSARHEEERAEEGEAEDDLFGYDFSQGYTSLEKSTASTQTTGPIRRWLEERREARRQQQQALEQEEERRVDEILGRLHEQGMESLSPEERLLLQRVSQRYRHRQERSS